MSFDDTDFDPFAPAKRSQADGLLNAIGCAVFQSLTK